ncbi:MAG: hypothetical protein Q4C53_08070 [Clostridia bacterium]|nr:hypothetical protein [Clostridia bacterium]
MLEWFKALVPLLVAIVPLVVAVVQSGTKTQKDIGMLRGELAEHIKNGAEREQKQRRVRILRFADEVRRGKTASKEYWTEVISDVDDYRAYCLGHPDFINSKGEAAMEYLLDEYNKLMRGEKR